MRILIVVNNPLEWPLRVPGVEVVAARSYLVDPKYGDLDRAKVFNFCRSYRYQSTGYYVSLLAAARGHKPIPDIATIQDMKSQTVIRLMSDELEEIIQEGLVGVRSKRFTLSIYFGRNLAAKHDRLSAALFKLFQAPFVRAEFVRADRWELQSIGPIAARDIPDAHHDFVVEAASQYLAGRGPTTRPRIVERYDLAILFDPKAKDLSSDEPAIEKFIKAAANLGIHAEVIDKEDFARVAEFDALFLRETTSVNHHTYRFSRRAVAEGLVVVDDPDSILKCGNKVYLAELLDQRHILTPKTLIVHRDNLDQIVPALGLPCILKQPDSAFSQGVIKAETPDAVTQEATAMLERSDLVIAQEFLPTKFDWRIGIFDRKPLYACQYFMADKHWQIINRHDDEDARYGRVKTLPVELAPSRVVRTALKAANLIGDGLYGVDLKQVGRKCYVIEVNDNPTIQAGFEDAILKDALYQRIMEVFLQRLERRRQGLPA
ncbi:MAG: RimK family protein [Verrucomicrobia bacterium]|nr:RimK family protein [Verrucomicrobiota bacterium]